MNDEPMHPDLGIAGRLAHSFLNSKLTPLFIAASLALGIFAVAIIPREEEPQILVPMLDIATAMPGASPAEVEQRVTLPIEELVHQISGVEYVYSTSMPGQSLVIVRFLVGTPQEDALIKVYSKLYSNFDRMPPGVSQPIIKARSIDDVPILSLTLWGDHYNGYQLRAIADEVQHSIQQVDNVSETPIIGGLPRTMRVILSTTKLNAYGLSPMAIVGHLQAANASVQAGSFAENNSEIRVDAGNLFTRREDLEAVVVAVDHGRPVYLRDVAEQIVDGPADPADYVLFGTTQRQRGSRTSRRNSIPPSPSPWPSAKAPTPPIFPTPCSSVCVQMQGVSIPNDVTITTTRNYGETAKAKSDELLEHLLLATLSVTLLVALFLGWRESGVVLLAIPVTLALTMSIFYFLGYTINRVTLFALIFSIGILVDDAIVVVENMVRHFRLPENHGRPMSEVAVEAVAEVGNPTILATFAVIAAVLPMAFVRGLMGPYMRPIPVGASAAMLFSLMVAFVVSPWAALRLLGKHLQGAKLLEPETENWRTRIYRKVMTPLITSARNRYLFFAGVLVLLLISVALVPLGLVRVKMLPFDNKSELQVVINMPDGTPLEQTARVAQALGTELGRQPDVLNYQVYAGTSGPYNFNGLVRHYYMRRQPNQADIQVNLLPAKERSDQSHTIAKRLRPLLLAIGNQYGARIQVSEVPPGPPVVQTLVAEVYGPDLDGQTRVAQQIKAIFKSTPGVVDTDWYVEDPQPRLVMRVDEVKAAQHGIAVSDVAQALALALSGTQVGLLHDQASREPVPAMVELDRADRSSEQGLENIRLPGADGSMVSLRELVIVEAQDHRAQHLSQESASRRLRHRRCGGRGRKPGLRNSENEQGARSPHAARRLHAHPLQRVDAGVHRPLLDEVGRRMADHPRGLSRHGPRLCRRARSDLCTGRRLVPLLHRAADHHGADSPHAGRHHARARHAGRILHRHFHDRFHRRRRHHRAQFHHPRRFHRTAHSPRDAAGRSSHRRRRNALPAHAVDCGRSGRRRKRDSLRPHLSGPCSLADCRSRRLHISLLADDSHPLLHGSQMSRLCDCL